MMIENLIREQFFRGDNKKYLISNNQIPHYRMHLFLEWIRQKHEKLLRQFLEKERCKTKIRLSFCSWIIGSLKVIDHISIGMNSLRGIDIKNCTYYFFNELIKIKNLDPNKIQINEKV